MKYLLLLSILMSGLRADAQSPFFSLYHDQDTLYWSHNFLIETTNGDIVQVCRQYELTPDTNYLIFRRFDANGTLLAARRVVPPTGIALQMYDGTELPDGSFLLFGADIPRAVIVHLDAMGNLISVVRRNVFSSWYQSLLWMNDSTLLAIGLDAPSTGHKLLLSRFDQTGNHLGSVGVQMEGQGAYGIMAIRSTEGGVLVCAQGEDTVGVGGFTNVGRTWLLRLDELASVLWARNYRDGARLTYPIGMAEDVTGRIWIGGNIWSVGNYTRQFLMELDANGDTLSTREYTNSLDPTVELYGRSFMSPNDSALLFTGWTDDVSYLMSVDTSGTTLASMKTDAAQTLELPGRSASGDLLIPVVAWAPTAGMALGPWRTNDPFSLPCNTPMNITTSTFSPMIDQGFTVQPITMIFDDITALCAEGPSPMTMYDPCLPSVVEALPEDRDELRIWPVPATDRITVEAGFIERIIIHDPLGRIVLSLSGNGEGAVDLDLNALATGVHLLSIQTNDGRWFTRSFIKQ